LVGSEGVNKGRGGKRWDHGHWGQRKQGGNKYYIAAQKHQRSATEKSKKKKTWRKGIIASGSKSNRLVAHQTENANSDEKTWRAQLPVAWTLKKESNI